MSLFDKEGSLLFDFKKFKVSTPKNLLAEPIPADLYLAAFVTPDPLSFINP